MYRKSITAVVLFTLIATNVVAAEGPISDEEALFGVIKLKLERDEALTWEENKFAQKHGLFQEPESGPPSNLSRDNTMGGPDDFGYTWINSDNYLNGPTYNWIDTTGATALYPGGLGDDYRVPVEIPFPFYYYGDWVNSAWMTTNGWAGFSASYASSYWTNYPIPDDGYGPDNMACPLWDDFKAASATGSYHGTMYHKTTGNAPNRQFTLIWWELVRNWNYTTEYADSQYFSFQMVLSEGTNNITFQYHDVTGYASADNGVGGTVGLENHDGSGGLQYEYNGDPQLVYDGMAIEFFAPPPGPPAPIFFSEYAEGSSNNKYLEIYNPNDGDVFLDDYVILGNYNGNPFSEVFEIAHGALLAAGDVYVIANAEANSEIVALANEAYAYGDTTSDGVTIYVATFNGDDVRALAYAGGGGDTVIMDIIGTLEGGDPGAGWAVAGVDDATKDHTLVRKGYPDGALQGNGGDWVMSAGTDSLSSEWLVEERPTADYTPSTLGEHSHGPPPEPCTTNEVTFNMYDNWGDGWNGGTYTLTNEAGEVVATGGMTTDNCSDGGYASNACNFAADILCLPNSAYGLVVGGGSWDSEITWDIVDSLGVVLASGDAPYAGDVYIGVAPPPDPPTLSINEFLASSELCCDDGYATGTDSAEFEDFIEIYNPGTDPVDIGGLWITDNLDDVGDWEMIADTNSAATTVAGGGFITIWADKDPDQGILHTTDIKLSSDGEQIGLIYISGTDTVFVDSLSFGAQAQDTSRGRDPDGSETWVSLSPPSPGITNFVCQDNEVTFHMIDSWGDGWNGNVYTLVDALSGDTVGTGGLLSGAYGADEYCLPTGFYDVAVGGGSFMGEVSWEMSMLSSVGVDSVFASGGAPFDATVNLDTTGTLGCMDMAAENYDAGATLDDGSCFYVGDYCEFPDTAALGDNNVFLPVTIVYDDAGVPEDTLVSEKWFVYTAGATERGFLTATTCYAGQMEDTDVRVYDGCPIGGGMLIAENDDAQCDDITGGNPFGSEVTFVCTPGQTYYFHWLPTWDPSPFTWKLEFSPPAPYNLATSVGVEELGLSWNAYPLSEPEPAFIGTVGNSDDEQEAYEALTEKKMIYASQVETIPSVTREDVRRKYASLPQTRDASVIFTLYDSWGDGYWGNGYIVTASSVAGVDSIVYTAPGGNWGSESAHPLTLPDGLYWVYFGYSSFQSETTWDVVNAADDNIVYASGTAYASATAPVYFAIGDYNVPTPDLTVSNIVYNYWTDALSVDVINLGDATAGGFDVKGYLTSPDNAGECNDYNYDLYANSQTLTGDDTLTISWSGIRAWLDANHPDSNPGGFGSYTFGFMADWGCDVGELDEYNNSATQAVTVVSPLDVVVFNIYRQDEAGGDFDSLTSVTGVTNYMDTGLVGEHVYGYKVNQVDTPGAAASAMSVPAYGSSLHSVVLPVPANLTGTSNGWHVELMWDDVVPEVEGQGFENGVVPEGWSTTTNSAVGWFITQDASSEWWTVPPGNGFYAASNDDAANDDGSMDYLITPSVDLTSVPAVLSFSSYFDGTYSQTAHVEVSTDGGESFTEVLLVTPSSDWTTINVDLNAYAAETNVMVAFHSNDNGIWATGWAVDDIVLGQSVDPIFSYYTGYYNLYRYNLDGANPTAELFANTSNTSYSVYQTEPGTYTYAVTALYEMFGESEVSNTVDVVVTAPDPHEPPANLMAESMGNDVHLSWVPPFGGPAWLSHSEGGLVSAVGTDGPAEFSVAHRFAGGALYAYDGMWVTQIELIPNVATATYQPFVMQVPEGAGTVPGNENYVSVGDPIPGSQLMMGQWNTVPVPPHQVDWNYELWIGYHVVTPEGYPAGCTAGPALQGYGDLITGFSADWISMGAAYGIDLNWALGAFVSYPPPPPQVMMNPGFEETYQGAADWQLYATNWFFDPSTATGNHHVAPTGDGIYGSTETFVAFDGSYSLKMWGQYSDSVNVTAYFQPFVGESWNHPVFPPGTAISIDAEIMSHADDWIGQGTNFVQIGAQYFDVDWNPIGLTGSTPFSGADEASVWHHRHVDAVVPEGAAYVAIGVQYVQSDNGQHGSAYIDNLTAHIVPPESTGGNNVVVNTIQTGKVSNQFDMVDLIPKTNGLDLPIMEQADRSMLLGYEVRDGSDSVAATGMTQTWTNLFDEGWGNHVYTVVAVYDDAISVPSNEAEVNLVNNPPGDFLLLAPPQGALLAINLDNADDQAAFMWEPSSDLVDNDPISYTISLTETTSGATVSFDTTTNGVFIDYMVFVELLTMADTVENTTFEWTVYANDGWDSTAAGNGPRAFTVDISNYLSAIENAGIPDEFALYNNYPNPFNPITNIKYDIPEVADVHLEIYNVAGQRIRTLVQGQQEPGRYKVQWAAKNDYGRPVASGMYIYRIRAGDFVSVKKLVLMK